jgi:hypothetical protein
MKVYLHHMRMNLSFCAGFGVVVHFVVDHGGMVVVVLTTGGRNVNHQCVEVLYGGRVVFGLRVVLHDVDRVVDFVVICEVG